MNINDKVEFVLTKHGAQVWNSGRTAGSATVAPGDTIKEPLWVVMSTFGDHCSLPFAVDNELTIGPDRRPHLQTSGWTSANAGPDGDHVDVGFDRAPGGLTTVMRFPVSEALEFAEGIIQAARITMTTGSNVTHEQDDGLADPRADTRPPVGM